MSTRRRAGRKLLQVPGPTNVPEPVLEAIARPTIDHRGPEFAELTLELLPALGRIFKTSGPVVIYPSSGTGAWEAALANVLSPGDAVLAFETGHFARLWCGVAERLGLRVEMVPGDWRHAVDPAVIGERLAADVEREIKAVMVVHNETSTGVTSPVAEVRAAMDAAGHPALLLVDVISSLGSIDYRHDEWGVDVTVGGSQKGLMLPPGLGFNAIGERALAASEDARSANSYWHWAPVIEANRQGMFPYTPATNMLAGLRVAIGLLEDEGLDAVFARHQRHAAATRAAVRGWGLETVCADERAHSAALTGVMFPEGRDADEFRRIVHARFGMALGSGLGQLAGRAFRIGHLGDFDDLMLAGTLSGVQMGLVLAGVEIDRGGLLAALDQLERESAPAPRA